MRMNKTVSVRLNKQRDAELLRINASMSVEELWKIYEEISKLEAKILAEKKKLERRLNSLQPPKTDVPKFANPDEPSQVWSGRGNRPQWITEKLASGQALEDLSIGRGLSVAAMPEEDDS
jgi:DNA-binding protein H-NS